MAPTPVLFDIGHVVRTPGALLAMVEAHVSEWSLLERHQRGDHGDVSSADRASNEEVLGSGGVQFSAYCLAPRTTLWLITEPHFRMTTLLLPTEFPQRFPRGLQPASPAPVQSDEALLMTTWA